MKFLDRVAMALFSIIIFALAILMCLVLLGWFDIGLIQDALTNLKGNEVATNVTIGVCIVLLLLALKVMFFDSYGKKEDKTKEGILLENDNGKLLVSRDTLENLATNVAKTEKGVENVVSRVLLDKDNHLLVFVNLYVKQDSIIKDISSGLQTKIKQTVKESLGLDVKEVNIKIKNISDEKNESQPLKEKVAEKPIVKEPVNKEPAPIVKEPVAEPIREITLELPKPEVKKDENKGVTNNG